MVLGIGMVLGCGKKIDDCFSNGLCTVGSVGSGCLSNIEIIRNVYIKVQNTYNHMGTQRESRNGWGNSLYNSSMAMATL
jgi:hypothetical protein